MLEYKGCERSHIWSVQSVPLCTVCFSNVYSVLTSA